MKKGIYIFIIIIFMFFAISAGAQDLDLDVKSAILIDADTGQVLYEINADLRLPPASMTKIMQMLIVMEQVEAGEISLGDELTVSRYAASMGGSQIFLNAGTRLTVEELLKAVTIASANDASVVLGEGLAGTYGNFIDWMNRRARELGMENTNFVNSTGLPDEFGEHYSSARDIAIMSQEMVKYPLILEWGSIWIDYIDLSYREAMLVNTNRLINRYPGMDGLKTGYTTEAGYCLASTAQRNNTRLISVIFGAESEDDRGEISTRLLDYGFNAFNKELIVSEGDLVQNIEVPDGSKTVTTGEVAEDLFVHIRRGSREDYNKRVVLEDLEAPIAKGQLIGEIRMEKDSQVLARVNLIATEDIERAGFFTRIWRSFVNWIGGLLTNLLG
ncbi:D-alanyl-D-alanine carboxypeptidase family protein [Natronospora cellulosivora (SeqCode)]